MASTKHVFFECPLVKDIWKSKGIWDIVKSCRNLSVRNSISLISSSGSMSLDALAMTCWAFWRERCDLKHGNDTPVGRRCTNVSWVDAYLADHHISGD